jgi:hypothetical protein
MWNFKYSLYSSWLANTFSSFISSWWSIQKIGLVYATLCFSKSKVILKYPSSSDKSQPISSLYKYLLVYSIKSLATSKASSTSSLLGFLYLCSKRFLFPLILFSIPGETIPILFKKSIFIGNFHFAPLGKPNLISKESNWASIALFVFDKQLTKWWSYVAVKSYSA